VVVLTILAAESFDPRLIWDRLEDGSKASGVQHEGDRDGE
jgi:uncharacterized paraquat-inducible protein A